MTEPNGRVLIVDDQFLIVQYLRTWVEAFGFEVCDSAATANEAVEKARTHRPDAILMDVRLEGERDGIDAAHEIYAERPCRMIYVTGSTEASTIKRIKADHPFAILIKPIDPQELGRALTAA